MSAQIADSKFTFALPSLSYIDAHWEEPNLRLPSKSRRRVHEKRVGGWLSRQMAAFVAWRRNNEAARELGSMSDRQLADIGLSRLDLTSVFSAAANRDLRLRGDGVFVD